MRTVRILGLSLFILSGLAAFAQGPSAATQTTTDVKPSKATVYVYRYKQFVGSALAPSVWCDETELAHMENGRYFTVKLDPGKHNFRSNDKQSGMELDIKPGEQYFVRLEIATGFMKGHGRLILVTPEQGTYELNSSKLKPLDSNKVINATLVSVNEAHPETLTATPKPALLVDTH
ncbi:MAG TPA: DUF2846 domain-containing protein [Terriglobales bacterium]|nr:DUF2846 domain-containing protein [Terriglobales bacterium]